MCVCECVCLRVCAHKLVCVCVSVCESVCAGGRYTHAITESLTVKDGLPQLEVGQLGDGARQRCQHRRQRLSGLFTHTRPHAHTHLRISAGGRRGGSRGRTTSRTALSGGRHRNGWSVSGHGRQGRADDAIPAGAHAHTRNRLTQEGRARRGAPRTIARQALGQSVHHVSHTHKFLGRSFALRLPRREWPPPPPPPASSC